MKKSLCIFIVLFLIYHAKTPPSVWACSCAKPVSVEEEYNRSVAVFAGEVTRIEVKQKSLKGTKLLVHFNVLQTWKGIEHSSVTVATGIGDGDCGYPFVKGKEYIVYAKETLNGLETVVCDRTKEIEHAEEDLGALGEGELPTVQREPFTETKQIYLIYGLILFGILILGMFFMVRKVKKRR